MVGEWVKTSGYIKTTVTYTVSAHELELDQIKTIIIMQAVLKYWSHSTKQTVKEGLSLGCDLLANEGESPQCFAADLRFLKRVAEVQPCHLNCVQRILCVQPKSTGAAQELSSDMSTPQNHTEDE